MYRTCSRSVIRKNKMYPTAVNSFLLTEFPNGEFLKLLSPHKIDASIVESAIYHGLYIVPPRIATKILLQMRKTFNVQELDTNVIYQNNYAFAVTNLIELTLSYDFFDSDKKTSLNRGEFSCAPNSLIVGVSQFTQIEIRFEFKKTELMGNGEVYVVDSDEESVLSPTTRPLDSNNLQFAIDESGDECDTGARSTDVESEPDVDSEPDDYTSEPDAL